MKNPIKTLTNYIKMQFTTTPPNTDSSSDNDSKEATFATYNEALQKIKEMRTGTAPEGKAQFNRCLNLRAANAAGGGPEIETDRGIDVDEHSKQFLHEFLQYNGFSIEGDATQASKWAAELESEGKLLVYLYYDPNHTWTTGPHKGMIAARVITYTTHNYTVNAYKKDYTRFEKVTIPTKEENELPEELTENEFVYGKIGGLIDEPNAPNMPMWDALRYCIVIEKALKDYREINRLYAAPTPTRIFNDLQSFKNTMQAESGKVIKFGIKKLFTLVNGELKYVTPEMTGAQSIDRELEINIKQLSAITGVPVTYLGMPELIRNHSTDNDSNRDMINDGTRESRTTLANIFNQMVQKAAIMYQEETKKKIDMTGQRVTINPLSQAQWAKLEKIYIPMALEGKLSTRTLHENIPGIDPDLEEERLQDQAKKETAYEYETSNSRADQIETQLQEN